MKNKPKYISLLNKSLNFYPETHKNLITMLQGLIEDNYTVLDIGCGIKIITRHLACAKLVGIDVYADYLTEKDIHGDVRNLDKLVEPKSYDVVIAIDLIEHLTKTEGWKLLKDMESVAIKKIMITTPIEWSKNIDSVKDEKLWSYNNYYNYHKSLWSKEDFISKGYSIVTNGFCDELLLAVKGIS
jgi:hypothetical protein